MRVKQENLTDWEARMLLETVWQFLDGYARRRVIETSPSLYNKACGWDVVDIRHGNARITVEGRKTIEDEEV